ncbi:MoaD/ThiS family protein [Methanofollis ethanolicus]|uniref:MoaD/ThiS family protein n=1 Tax=Methanofollis ethanolicus TaxID=488124 RepID=UPI00128EB81F|nr:MoaD/ThiS family protein [Methanofollis ethanolicus]
MMKVHLSPDRTEEIAVTAATVEAVLLMLGVNPVEVIVSRNGALVPEDTVVGGDDELRVIRFVHGG